MAQIISSLPDSASGFKHGLSDKGKAQAAVVHEELFRQADFFGAPDTSEVVVYASDFRRTLETAQGLANGLNSISDGPEASPLAPCPSPALRERSFGSLNLKSDSHYASVWEADADPAGEWGERGREADLGVEPVQSVQERATRFLVEEVERNHSGALVVLVAHGDILQILQTAFERVDPRTHRNLPHLNPCGVRSLVLKPLAPPEK